MSVAFDRRFDASGEWAGELAELQARRDSARAMGGPAALEKFRASGRLNARERIALGQAQLILAEVFEDVSGQLRTSVRQLRVRAASGEASGRLDIMLERAADYLEREFDSFTAAALALLEPAIIVVMGAIVALIVLSIMLPILQLDTLAGTMG